MSNDASVKWVAPQWYRVVLWPVLLVGVVGIVFLVTALVLLIHSSLAHSGGAPGWVIAVGIICMGVGGFTARTLQMVVAIQQRRWQKEHPEAPAPMPYGAAPQTSDDAAVESLGLHWTGADDEQR